MNIRHLSRLASTLSFPLALAVTLAAGLGSPACQRDELEHICTPVQPGQLVISELRGPQADLDTYGQWIELYNNADTALNLAGIELRLRQLDGSSEVSIRVRDENLEVGPRGYVVLGRFPDDSLPDHVDYGYTSDFESNLYADGILELYVCNELVDTVIYRDLPETGSLSFDGNTELTVDNNDLESNWCNDASDVGGDPTEVGVPGTPGEQNRPCN